MKYWKRLLSMTLAAALLLAQPGGMVLAGATKNVVSSISDWPIARSSTGSCGDNVQYSFNAETGVMTISGTGPMHDYGYYGDERAPWSQGFYNSASNDTIEKVIISEGVTRVGNSAFENCSKLESVELPNTLTEIGTSAFKSAPLISVSIPENVNSIGNGAFAWTSLTEIAFPATVTSVGNEVMQDCKNLTTVTLSGQTAIGDNAFKGCTSLTQITLPAGLQTIGANAFDGSGLTEINIPETVTSIGSYAFARTSLNTANIPASVQSLGGGLFSECMQLSSVTLSSAANIPGRMFEKCSALTSITIPEGVQSIGNYAFQKSGLQNIQLPSSLTEIGAYAFNECKSLSTVQLPQSLTSMGNFAFGSTGLTEVSIPDSVNSLGDSVFQSCPELKTVNFGTGLTTIPKHTFAWCPKLEYVVIPEGVLTIGDSAFRDCGSLKTFVVSDTVQSINRMAFYNCQNLSSVTIPSSVVSFPNGEDIFQNSPSAVIYCYPASKAVEHAQAHKREYVLLDSWGGVGMKQSAENTYTLAWEPVENAQTYQVVKVTEQGAYAPVGEATTQCTFTSSELTEDAIYRVIANLTEGPAMASRVATAFVASDEPPKITSYLPVANDTLAKTVHFEVFVSGSNPVSSLKIAYRQAGAQEFTTIAELTEDNPSQSVTFEYDWDISALTSGTYEVQLIATDLAGLVSEPVIISYEVLQYKVPAAPVLTGESAYQSAILSWNSVDDGYFFDHYEIYRDDSLLRTTYSTSFTDTITETANYYVAAVDRYGVKASSNTVTVTPKEDEIPPEAIITQHNLSVRPDEQITFDGTLSTDNVGITAYTWDFGDGETASGSTASHAYSEEGTYTVTLTVTDAEGNAGTAQTSVAVAKALRQVEFTTLYLAANAETPVPIGNTDITIVSTETEDAEEILLRTDANGQAATSLKTGHYTVSAISGAATLSGYVLYVEEAEETDPPQQEELVLTRKRSGGLTGSLTVHEMQYDEIVAAGIDVTNPDNQFVYKYEAKFIYGNDYDMPEITFDYYVNKSGNSIGHSGGDGQSTGGSGDGMGTGGGPTTGTAITGGWYYAEAADVYIQPLGGIRPGSQYFLVIDGSVGFLKQIFNVELLLVNSGGTDWVENCYAEIELPEGLSLAAMNGGSQTERVLVNDDGVIEANEQGVAEWYVRGDLPGEHKIKVNVDGEYFPQPSEYFEMEFPYSSPIIVRDAKGSLNIQISDAPESVTSGETVEMTLSVTNTSDNILYGVTVEMNGPAKSARELFDAIAPDETVTVSIEVTFDFGGSDQGTITKYLVDSTFACSDNIPPSISFKDDGQDPDDPDTPPDPEQKSQLRTTLTFYEQYDEADGSYQYPVTALTYSYGSFSWDKRLPAQTDREKTDFDKLFMQVTVTHELLPDSSTADTANNVTAVLTASDGFSFAEYELVTERTITAGNLEAGESYSECVPVYPIYTAEAPDSIQFKSTTSSSIHAAETRPINTLSVSENAFQSQMAFADTEISYSAKLTADMFSGSAYEYNHDLAKLALAMSSMEYRKADEIMTSYRNLGFSKIEIFESADIAYVNSSIASKKIIIDGKIVTLIALPIRGTASLEEWLGNLAFGIGTEEHRSFEIAKNDVLTNLYDYLQEYPTDLLASDGLKLLVTGHSRGAAVANLLAAELDTNAGSSSPFMLPNVYAYTFASPNTTKAVESDVSIYENIFNVVFNNDMVPWVPLEKVQGFKKYGITMRFPLELSPEYFEHLPDVISRYAYYKNNEPYDPLSFQDWSALIDIILGLVAKGWFSRLEAFLEAEQLMGKVLCSHCPANYMSWLESITPDEYQEVTGELKVVSIRCPVNVEVKNSEDELVGRITNNVVDTAVTSVAMYVEGDDKTVYLPSDGAYTFTLTGYDNGQMDFVVTEYENGEQVRTVAFADVPVVEGVATTGIVNTQTEEYSLKTHQNAEIEVTDDLSDDDIGALSVSVQTQGDGLVLGDGNYTKYDSVTLIALPGDTPFTGWYDEGELLSTDLSYTFIAEQDTSITARFSDEDPDSPDDTEEPDSPDVPGGSGGSSSGGGGGSSMSSGRPVVEVAGEGGTVTAGNDGTVTITPDEGYKIGKIKVNGEEVAIPADGKLTGLNQNDKVIVTFEKIKEVPTIIGSFEDVLADAWYAEAVQYALDNGIMNGTGATTFAPNESTTRAMIVTMLYRLEGEPDIDGESLGYPFADVDANAYYGDPVYWARLHGIVNGVSGTSYAPDDAITREQLASILYRYAQYKGYDTSVGGMSLAEYTDADQISAYAAAAMQWANGNGLITGRTDTTLVPQGTATRAEVATILMRFCTDVAQ